MQLIVKQGFYDDAYNAAKLVSGARDVYVGLKNLFFSVAVLIIALPFILLANILLFWLKNRLLKTKTVSIEKLSVSEYKTLRLNTDKLYQVMDILSDLVNEFKTSKPSFPFRKSCQLIIDIENICQSKHKENSEFLRKTNSDLKEYKGFESISEDELWKNRPSTYEYLV